MNTEVQILQAIVNEIKSSPALRYTRLYLQVQDGVVKISGKVNSFAHRKAVERAVNRVAGVKTLVLDIRAAAIPMTFADDARESDVAQITSCAPAG